MKQSMIPTVRLLALILLILPVSCALLEPEKAVYPRIPFPQAEYAELPASGTGTVTGRAFLKRGGDILTPAGEKVMLNPVTSYSNQWYTTSFIGRHQLEAPDPRINKYIRSTTADPQGRFTFRNVPPGDWYIITVISWQTTPSAQGGPETQGARLCRKITVRNGEETKVVLNQ